MNNKDGLSSYIQAITERYVPANNIEDATHRFSTEEICSAITRINPGLKISAADAYTAMKNLGFRFVAVPGTIGLQFKWILKEK